MAIRRAKIVATVGPATAGRRQLARLLKAGTDVVRLNFSHGDPEEHRRTLRRVRELAAGLEREIAVLVDLMGPRHRLARLSEPLTLKRGGRVRLGPPDSGAELPVESADLLRHVKKGERLLIDNGLVELRVENRRGATVTARVVNGGEVSSRKGINVPDSELPFEVSDKDRADVALAIAEEADFLGVSYVGAASDLAAVRAVMADAGGDLPLVAKLERGRAMRHLEEIVVAADAVMVARGDLGVEVPLHRVPVLQKRIIDTCRRHGRPVIVATQMLESMIERPRPTRAESTDVANAVLDGADALMLSGETAVGSYPSEAVKTMARIVRAAESYARTGRAGRRDSGTSDPVDLPRLLEPTAGGGPLAPGHPLEIADVVAAAAVFAARNLPVRQIVGFSQGGFTARMIARYRPSASILMFTSERHVARRVQLFWGVRPLLLEEEVKHPGQVVRRVDEELLAAGLAAPGDVIIVLMGDPIRQRPPTNLMRIHRVGGGA